MMTARVTLEPAVGMGPVNQRRFDLSVEHMGRCVCTVTDERDHPSADECGFPTDARGQGTEPGAIVRHLGGDGQPRVALPAVSFAVLRLTPATKENN